MPPPAGTPQSVGTNGIGVLRRARRRARRVNAPVDRRGSERRSKRAAALGVGAGMHPSADPSSADTAVLSDVVDTGIRSVVRCERRRPAHRQRLGCQHEARRAGRRHRPPAPSGHRGVLLGARARRRSRVPTWQRPRATGQPLDGTQAVPDPASHRARHHRSTCSGRSRRTGPTCSSYRTPRIATRSAATRPISWSRETAPSTSRSQHEQPTEGDVNWLPVPAGPFNVIMRCYLPRAPIVDGTYSYPPITVVA